MQRRKPSVSTTLRALRKKSAAERVAGVLTNFFGTLTFLFVNMLFFVAWIAINTERIPGLSAFDPFPFNLLTMVVSLEAIFLSVVVLVSQNKAATAADIREEIDFRINVESEREITKILFMLEAMEKHLHMKAGRDKVLNKMQRPLNIERIAKEVMEERLRS